MKKILKLVLLCCAISSWSPTKAQQILIDRGMLVEGLWCFPLVNDSLQYLYLPDKARLALDENKEPKFSFMQYVSSDPIKVPETNAYSIVKGSGGAILHFLVLYETEETKVARAQERLREVKGTDNISLRGPIVFNKGRFALVSSILNPSTNQPENRIMAMGDAPVLQGSSIALSFELDPHRAQLLMENFKMPTPDISLVFDLSFSGLSDAYNATLTVDWSKLYSSEEISGGLKVYFVSAEVEKMNESLIRNGAIKLNVMGEDDRMEKIVDMAYAKVTDLLFETVEPEQIPEAGSDLGILLNQLIGNKGASSAKSVFPFGAHVGYKLKKIKSSGTNTMDFSSRTTQERHHYITFNIGNIYKNYGTNEAFFKKTLLEDISFDQRQIKVELDGTLAPEFQNMINNVTLTLRKTHENGAQTIRELNVSKNKINAENTNWILTYGNANDRDKLAWLNYDYKTVYHFIGGKSYHADWERQSAASINLYAPYIRKKIVLEADTSFYQRENIRAVIVKIEYPFFGENKTTELLIRPQDNLANKFFEITLPENQSLYQYSIRWFLNNGTERTYRSESESSILFIDQLSNL